jgi:octaprenyl-diphosphate synthase
VELNEILLPVREDLEEFEKRFVNALDSRVELLNVVIRYVAQHRGKRLRPALVFLISRMMGHTDARAMEAAQIIELIHTATLIHDDVVDQSDMRRGAASVNAIWDNKISILVGDFLFAQALNLMMHLNSPQINRILSRVTRRMSEGELLQIQQSQNLQLDEESYFQMISDKTASLIAAACQIGAIIGSRGNGIDTELFWRFGTYMGCAFQIQDDLLDYIGDEEVTGKPAGNDIKENKITLPLIYAFHRNGKLPEEQLREFIRKEKTDAYIAEIRQMVIDLGGVDYARKRAEEFVEKALTILEPFEDNVYKRSLEELVQFSAVRQN